MIILKEQDTEQNLYATIWGVDADTIILRDEEENTETVINCTFSIDKYYAVTSAVFPVKEYKFYTLTIKNGANVVYKDKVFCTNQPINNYSLNNEQYVEHTTTNEYVIFD